MIISSRVLYCWWMRKFAPHKIIYPGQVWWYMISNVRALKVNVRGSIFVCQVICNVWIQRNKNLVFDVKRGLGFCLRGWHSCYVKATADLKQCCWASRHGTSSWWCWSWDGLYIMFLRCFNSISYLSIRIISGVSWHPKSQILCFLRKSTNSSVHKWSPWIHDSALVFRFNAVCACPCSQDYQENWPSRAGYWKQQIFHQPIRRKLLRFSNHYELANWFSIV